MKKEKKSPAQESPEILIAEDSPTQATKIKNLLERQNYKITVASDGKEAIRKLSKQKTSLVISDILMPEMNGYELCKQIKSNMATSHIPVILLTCLSDPEEIIEGLSCGADSFITIPFNDKHLLSNIEKILSEENQEDTIKVPFGVEIFFNGEKRLIQAEQQNVIKLMLDIYEGAIHQNEKLIQIQEELRLLNERLESLVKDRTADLTEEIKLSNQIAIKLKESEEKHRRIFENVQDLCYETSIEGKIIDISPSIEVLSKSQYHREDLIGTSMNDLYSDIDERATLISQIKEKGTVSDYEIILRNKDDSWILCSVSSKIIFDAHGHPEKIIGSMRDITERKKNESELIKAKEKAEESDRLKSAFLTNMSHEIRTPMNGILGFAELLKEPNLSNDDMQDYVQTIQISGARMLNTINSIVNISKIESGHIQIDIGETDINQKMEFTYKFFKPEADIKGLQLILKTSLPDKEAIIKTDNEKVYGILTNLVKNVIKFTFEGSIELGYEKKGEYLEFYVKDTGVGIPDNHKELIFERFRQGSESHNRGYEGSGMGLSIAKSYVEMLGGKIWVESEEGRGSTFYFTIPYNALPQEEIELLNTVTKEHNEVQLNSLKMLIVEDDEISYSLLSRMLQNISKTVLHAITGVEAIEVCRKNPDLDLVLMDIRMPKMDGNEATCKIRQFNKDVIIIAQTAYAFTGDKEKAIEAGCNDYISKPINKTLLNELIKKHINKK